MAQRFSLTKKARKTCIWLQPLKEEALEDGRGWMFVRNHLRHAGDAQWATIVNARKFIMTREVAIETGRALILVLSISTQQMEALECWS